MGDKIDIILGEKGGVLEDLDMNGVSSLLKMQESNSLRGLTTVVEETAKREFDGSNGVNLVAEACREVDISDAKVEGDNEQSLQSVPLDGNEKQSDGNEIEEEANLVDGEHNFSVGDFVWGKIKSHPWWPGRIYDPLDASDYAKKVKQADKILVAYFGDGTFAWCNPSQLKPFDDNFVEMSRQSSSKNFVNSFENAMDEIGRLVDLKMTCSCVPIDNLSGFGRTLVENAGIKEGLLIPEGGIDKFSAVLFEPVDLLTELKNAAQDATATSILEFTVLKSWLSAFYRTKGGHQLPSYYDPMEVPGLEDKSKDWTDDIGCVDVRNKGPDEEDWISSPKGRKYSQPTQSPSQKSQGFGHYQRRKQKSIAEILEGETDVPGGDKKSRQAKSSVKGKKRKSTEQDAADKGKIEANNGTDGEMLHKRKSPPAGKKRKSLKNDLEGKDKAETVAAVGMGKPRSSGRKKRKDNVTDENDVGENEETKNTGSVKEADQTASSKNVAKELLREESFSRERKKSKYLSPPYTNIATGHGKKEIVAHDLKVSSDPQLGDASTNKSPRIQLNGDLSQNQLFKETSAGLESDSSIPQTQSLEQTIDPSLVKAPAKEVLYGIRSAALNPSYLKDTNSTEVEKFFSAFRSSSYCSETNGEYCEIRHGRKRKLEKSEPESSVKEQSQTKTNNSSSSDHKSQRKKARKSEEAKPKEPKEKQNAVLPSNDTKSKNKNKNKGKDKDKESKEEATGASLLVTFGPGARLPSKNDIIKMYGKFGALNKKETEMFNANHCARVVFLKSHEAEAAFKACQVSSPFGSANVNFRVRYPTETKTRQLREISDGANAPLLSQLNFMKEKLEGISSMLGTSDGNLSGDLKSKLESEVRILLDKVSTMAKSAA